MEYCFKKKLSLKFKIYYRIATLHNITILYQNNSVKSLCIQKCIKKARVDYYVAIKIMFFNYINYMIHNPETIM